MRYIFFLAAFALVGIGYAAATSQPASSHAGKQGDCCGGMNMMNMQGGDKSVCSHAPTAQPTAAAMGCCMAQMKDAPATQPASPGDPHASHH